MAENKLSVTVHINAPVVGLVRSVLTEAAAQRLTGEETRFMVNDALDKVEEIVSGADQPVMPYTPAELAVKTLVTALEALLTAEGSTVELALPPGGFSGIHVEPGETLQFPTILNVTLRGAVG